MASVDTFWNRGEGYDIHVLAGETSPPLLDLLVIEEDTTPPTFSFARTPPADIDSVVFTANFESVSSPPENGGVKLDPATGQVTVAAAPTLRSFVIEAHVRTKAPNATSFPPVPIRVLVHTAIQEIWLTPPTLTIRHGADGQRLTVLARFDDDTVGDITRRPGIAWESSDDTRIVVFPSGDLGALTHPAAVTVTAKHAGREATARVEAKEPWSTPVAATLVPGSAGLAKAATVPNVLFLSEGFTAAEKPRFEALARGIVHRLQSTASLRPYDLAKGAANFWTAFVPSRERGTSVLYDMQPVHHAGTLYGVEIPAPAPPTGAAYSLENLVYTVGLPTPADGGVAAADARRNWFARYGPGGAANVADDVYARWQALRDHRLANEVDTALGIVNGQRPTMHQPRAPRLPALNPMRTTRAHLDPFLQNLGVGAGGPKIGAIWAAQDPASPMPDPTGPGLPGGLKAGQDQTLVFVLCGGARYGGKQTDGMIFSSLRPEAYVRLVEVFGTRQVELDPWELPRSASLETVATVAHETAHALGVDDEYGEFTTPLRIPAAQEAGLARAGNVQGGGALELSAADPRLDPAKLGAIKWLWPRLDFAGVLAAQPDAAGAGFSIKLARGHAHGLAPGDFVRLRRRPLLEHPLASGRLRVDAVAGDTVTVTALAGTAVAPGDWPAGSILIRPVRGAPTPGDRNGADLPLVAPVISAHLSASRLPLDRKPPPPAPPTCTVDDRIVQAALNLPAGLPAGRPRFPAQIVGLWDGGSRYYCGVYHPSGACLMRHQMAAGARPRTFLLCPVCRYVLVDRLDPTKHRAIDLDYRNRYPEP